MDPITGAGGLGFRIPFDQVQAHKENVKKKQETFPL